MTPGRTTPVPPSDCSSFGDHFLPGLRNGHAFCPCWIKLFVVFGPLQGSSPRDRVASLGALHGRLELVPQRRKLRLGLDDVVADGAGLRPQFGLVGRRKNIELATLVDPGPA